MFYDRFNDSARKVMAFARQEAHRFNHDYIGTEHLLLGLTKLGDGVAVKVLRNLGVDIRKVALEVHKMVQSGPDVRTKGQLPFTPRAKHVIEFTLDEARSLGHSYIGTEHILLGMMREAEGVAASVLMSLGVSLESVRNEILRMLENDEQTPIPVVEKEKGAPSAAGTPFSARLLDLLQRAHGEARAMGSNEVVAEHVLLALLSDPDSPAAKILLNEYGVTAGDVRERLRRLAGEQT